MLSKVGNRSTTSGLFGCALALAGALAVSAAPASARDLSFDERVKAQEAIERVSYSHLIGAKRSFEAAVPRTVLEAKVRTYLEQSQALDKFWNTPVTEEMLARELQRMARQTRMPERLQELYNALGNDSFLIEECLARPALVGRMARNFFAFDQTIHADERARAEEIHGHLKAGRIDPWTAHPDRTEIAVARVEADAAAADEAGHASPGRIGDPSFLELAPDQFDRFGGLAPDKVGEIGPLIEERDLFVSRILLEKGPDTLRVATFVVRKRSWDEWWKKAEHLLDAEAVRAVASGRDVLPTPALGPRRSSGSASGTEVKSGPTAVSATGSSVTTLSSAQLASASLSGGQISTEIVPIDDTWDNGSLYNVPDPRYDHTAVWTGSVMIVWGGFNNGAYLNSGGIYDPAIDSWTQTTVAGAPPGRAVHTAVWTGSKMVVWGGYSPTIIDTFAELCPTPGSIVKPIEKQFNPTNTGGRYDPLTDTWQPTGLVPVGSGTAAPAPRYGHTAVWSSLAQLMIVWGGYGLERITKFQTPALGYLDSGATYDPDSDQWRDIPQPAYDCLNPDPGVTPTGRWAHSAALVKDVLIPNPDPDFPPDVQIYMMIWGGYGATAYQDALETSCDPNQDKYESPCNPPQVKGHHYRSAISLDYRNTGNIYDVANQVWLGPTATSGATPATSAPDPREYQTAVFTGSKLIVWGGYRNGVSLNTGGQYDPVANSWSATSTKNAPSGRYYHSAVWTDTQMLVWGGFDGLVANDVNTGGRYSPAGDSWTPISTTNAPGSRYKHSAVWASGITGRPPTMIVWGGDDSGQPVGSGGQYDPAADSWTPTEVQTGPEARTGHVAAWTGSEMIVWGGFDSSTKTYFSSGNRYDPTLDAWTPIPDTGAPQGRSGATEVWSGSEMIVWGGYVPGTDPASGAPIKVALNTGGRFNPTGGLNGNGTWTATSSVNAPDARQLHSAVWTGSRMIVWGGLSGTSRFNTGGRYSPAGDAWTPTSTNGAPSSRQQHSAVWTGSQMIVWGGYDGTYLNTGGRYDPATDTWTPTSLTGAPPIRRDHAAVWTGAPTNRMLVWGGFGTFLDSDLNPTSGSLSTGSRYDPGSTPGSDTWTAMSTTSAPEARFAPSSIWTGSQMIVWGGSKGPFGSYPSTGGRYDPASDVWTPTSLADVPSGRYQHTAVWTGNTMLVWGGYNGTALNSGGRYSALSGVLATFYRDADSDGCGDPASAVQSYSQPAGYVGNSLDCNDTNTSVWSAPSEVQNVLFTDGATLVWDKPSDPGATTLLYDAVRSGNASDFVDNATCVASGAVSPTAFDAAVPLPGQVFYYLIRADDGCPNGQGSLGADSSGTPRTARSCP